MPESSQAVFISYASQDAEVAKRICDALRAGGIEVWFDRSELRGGDAWDQKIRQQIRDCALFIPLISANTALRHEGYFRLEWDLADRRTQMIARNRAFIVPVCSDATSDAGADVPESFVRVQWTRLPAGETPSDFVQRVSTLLSAGAPGANAPARMSTGPAPSAAAPGPSAPKGSKLVPLLITALAILGVGYFALNKFVLSKHVAPPASTTASAPGEPAATPTNDKSIAVLPFADMSEKKDQAYFSDGLAEELLDLLAKTPGLHVIARTSSFSFKEKSDDIPTIGRKLNVANILEGSVRKSGNRLRVTTQLIRAGTGEELWSETYDRELKDVFAVQDEIAAAVVSQLKLKLAPAPPTAARRTSNVEAYNEYLLARRFHNGGNEDGFRREIEAYRKAIALDPHYAAAYAGLAISEATLADDTGDAAGLRQADADAERAVELAPEEADGYASRGFLRFSFSWDWAGAQADLAKALILDPADSGAQDRYSRLLAALGRLPEATAAMKKAVELDPLRAGAWNSLGGFQMCSGDFAAAQEALRRALEIQPEFTYGLLSLGMLQMLESKTAEALSTFRKNGKAEFRLLGVAIAEHTLGHAKESQEAINELIAKDAQNSAYQIAEIYAWRGESTQAFEWLDRAHQQRDGGLVEIKADPLMDSLRSDPRYKMLLRKMKLPE